MKRYLFVALALVVLLIVPASAYTLVYTSTGATTETHTHFPTRLSYWWNMSITHIEAEFDNVKCGAAVNTTGTYSNVLNNGGASCGNYTATWTVSDSNTFQPATLTIDYDDYSCPDPGAGVMNDIILQGLYQYIEHGATCSAYNEPSTNPESTYPFGAMGNSVSSSISYTSDGEVRFYSGLPNSVVASFTCTPTSQFPDTDIVCTDTSTNNPDTWLWSIDAEALGIEGWQTSPSQNFTWQSSYPGLYSVNLWANNTGGGSWENKTNYVSISDNATPNNCNIPVVPGLIRSWAQCVDSQTSGAVAGCDLSLYDLEGGAWSNVTDRFDGTWCIDTYPAHHFNAYGSADGYTPDPTYRLNLNVNEHVVYELLMHPGYVPPAAEGKVWVYGIVNDADTGAAIEGAVVRLDASGQTSKSDTTDAAGSMHIQWVNKTQTTATASKAGYGTISKVFATSDYGPDTVRIELHRSIVTPTATATTGPGGTVPTTVNPNGPNNGVYPADYTSTQGQAIMNLLAYHGYDLVLLCILVTMMALLGFKLGGR